MDERKARRAARRKKGLPGRDRIKGSRGNLHKIPDVELTEREKRVALRWADRER